MYNAHDMMMIINVECFILVFFISSVAIKVRTYVLRGGCSGEKFQPQTFPSFSFDSCWFFFCACNIYAVNDADF